MFINKKLVCSTCSFLRYWQLGQKVVSITDQSLTDHLRVNHHFKERSQMGMRTKVLMVFNVCLYCLYSRKSLVNNSNFYMRQYQFFQMYQNENCDTKIIIFNLKGIIFNQFIQNHNIVKPYIARPMAYPQKYWGTFNNPEFNRLHTQIQQQTQALLRQRSGLSNNFTNNSKQQQPYLEALQSQRFIMLQSERNRNASRINNPSNLMPNRVQQLIGPCRNQNSAFGNQLLRLLGEQKDIYDHLISSSSKSEQITQYFGISNPIIEAQKESSVVQGSRQQQTSSLSSINQSPGKPELAHKSIIRQAIQRNPSIQVGDDLLQMIQEIERKTLNQMQRLKQQKIVLIQQLKQEIKSKNLFQGEINSLSQQLQRPVNQNSQNYLGYQNVLNSQNSTYFGQYWQDQQKGSQKALLQQQILKQIRFQMDSLKRQNQSLRHNLNARPQQLKKNTNAQQRLTVDQNEFLGLRDRVYMLQEQLQSRDRMINGLTLEVARLNQQSGVVSSNPQQLRQLLAQGQSIRQNTLHLIHLKESPPEQSTFLLNSASQFRQSDENQRTQELEEVVQRQEEEKQSFLYDLLAFKQKYQQLEEQNRSLKRKCKFGTSDLIGLSPTQDKPLSRGNLGVSSGQYQRLSSQVRGSYY